MPSRRPGIISADAIAKNGGARKIRLNRRSVTGYVPSRKTGALIPHESTLERDAIILYDGDPNVRSVIAQPLHIVGNGRTYTPDLLVEYNDGVELKEIKYQDDLDVTGNCWSHEWHLARGTLSIKVGSSTLTRNARSGQLAWRISIACGDIAR